MFDSIPRSICGNINIVNLDSNPRDFFSFPGSGGFSSCDDKSLNSICRSGP